MPDHAAKGAHLPMSGCFASGPSRTPSTGTLVGSCPYGVAQQRKKTLHRVGPTDAKTALTGSESIAARGCLVQYREAKEMYFRYDGSRFGMDRDGPIGENLAKFDSYRVPDEVLRTWDDELIAGHLAHLDQPANWHVISFLMHRGFGAYLIELTAQPPLGRLRDRFIYLECLLRYADHCSDDRTVLRFSDAHYEAQHLWRALDQVLLWAQPLLRIARAAESTKRVRGVISGAEQRLGVCEDATGCRVALWRWDSLTASATPVRIGS